MKNPFKVLLILIALVGLACMIFGTGYYFKHKVPSDYKNTSGTVTTIKPVTITTCVPTGKNYGPPCKNTPGTVYHATVSFTVGSQQYSFDDNLGGEGENSYRTGQTVNVAYDPTNPNSKPQDTDNNMTKGVGQIFAVIGLVFFLVGAIPLFVKRK